MTLTTTPDLRGVSQPNRADGQQAPRKPETPAERHARRVAFGRMWGQVAKEHSAKIRAREATR